MNYRDKDIIIRREWEKFICGQPVNEDLLSSTIYKSWVRSKKYGVDPYASGKSFMSRAEVEVEISRFDNLVKKYGDIIKVVSEMSIHKGFCVQVFGKNSNSIHYIASKIQDDLIGKLIVKEAAEDKIGTNAICLAILENRPIQVLGPEHFKYTIHDVHCSAAPIHDEKGRVIGAINIASRYSNQSIETLGLVTAIAKVFDNSLLINKMVEDLSAHNSILNQIIEYIPAGVVLLDYENIIQLYNQKVLDFFEVSNNNLLVNKNIEKYIKDLKIVDHNLDREERILNVKKSKKSFLISTKKILGRNNSIKGNLLIIEDTDKILKLRDTLIGNKAVYKFENIIGENHELKKLKDIAEKIAKSPSAVLLYGESGTGKELFAQAIHNASMRKDRPFVGINCGAIPSELIESELFGYEAGAFTGALQRGKIGKLELASKGTLFLDEIDSMPLDVQIKLLRALSTNKISKIGGLKEIPIDVRIISASKKDLLQGSEEGNFREDLFYRINVITLKIPPLRERKDDINVLTKHFVQEFEKLFGLQEIKITDEFFDALTCYDWRGNVRELKNVIERAIVLLDKKTELTIEFLPERIIDTYLMTQIKNKIKISDFKNPDSDNNLLERIEKMVIEYIIQQENGNITKAASRLGISRPTLYRRINIQKKQNK